MLTKEEIEIKLASGVAIKNIKANKMVVEDIAAEMKNSGKSRVSLNFDSNKSLEDNVLALHTSLTKVIVTSKDPTDLAIVNMKFTLLEQSLKLATKLSLGVGNKRVPRLTHRD